MKAFPFSLDGAPKDWLYLQPVMFNTLGDMKRMFLEKFFPTRYVEFVNTQGKLCMNIGRGLMSCVPYVHTTKSVNNYYYNISME
ncbi:hypothetical protein CR513_01413, partial [Mucuna pruriens]